MQPGRYLGAEEGLVAVGLLLQGGQEAGADAHEVLAGRRHLHQEASEPWGNKVQGCQGCQVQIGCSWPATWTPTNPTLCWQLVTFSHSCPASSHIGILQYHHGDKGKSSFASAEARRTGQASCPVLDKLLVLCCCMSVTAAEMPELLGYWLPKAWHKSVLCNLV